jgi:glycosyltransferase involved in cell wall biosynthesis
VRRVAHVIETLGPGGAERALLTYIQTMDAARFKHIVVTLNRPTPHFMFWQRELEEAGVEVHNLEYRGQRDVAKAVLALRRWLKLQEVALVSTHLYWANIVGRIAGRLAGVPVISTLHNPDYDEEVRRSWSRSARAKNVLVRLLDKWTVRGCCTRLVAVSAYVRERSLAVYGVSDEKIMVIHNPITPRHGDGSSPEQARHSLASEFGFAEHCRLLVNVGRVTEQKGQVDAVRSLASLVAGRECALVLVGSQEDTAYVREVRELAHELGVAERVHFAGVRADIERFLAAADVFVFPTRYEGMGMAVPEAMLAASPVVAYAVGPIGEMIETEVTGLLVAPRDQPAFTGAIERLLDSPALARELGENASREMRGRYTPSAQASLLEALFDETLDER